MALRRSAAPARSGRSLALSVVLPAVVISLILAAAAAFMVAGAAKRAANKELDARAATVKKAWDGTGRPTRAADLTQLGKRLNAKMRVVRGRHPQAATTSGKVRSYAFATRDRQTLRVALSTSNSSDAISKGLFAGLIVALAGALLLAALLTALLRGAAVGPLKSLAAVIERVHAGAHDARAPVGGAREVRAAAAGFNQVADQVAQLDRQAGTDMLTGLPSGPRVRQAIEVEIKRAERE